MERVFSESEKLKRGPYLKKYTEENIQSALHEIDKGSLSVYAAHKKYNIPNQTLRDRINGKHSQQHGNLKVLTDEQELRLRDFILLHADFGNPLTKSQILKVAGEIASLNLDPSKNFKNGTPSSFWLDNFTKRHPSISRRTPSNLGRASAVHTKDDLKNFFELVYNYFEKNNLLYVLERPDLWWNADESGFEMNPMPAKVYARKGAKQVYSVERGKPKEMITATYAFSGDGKYIEPLLTFKKSLSKITEIAVAVGSVGANFGLNQTESGWMKGDSFFFYVTQYLNQRWIEMELERPLVLAVDGYSGHHSYRLFQWCQENEVILIILYPNSTHILQMCDVAMFSPIKRKYMELHQDWKVDNPEKLFNEVEFVKVLKKVNDQVIKKESIVNGWRATGLQPFNFENVKLDRLVGLKSSVPKVQILADEIVHFDLNDEPPSASSSAVGTSVNVGSLSDDAMFYDEDSGMGPEYEDEDEDEDRAVVSEKTVSFASLNKSVNLCNSSADFMFSSSFFEHNNDSENVTPNTSSAVSHQKTLVKIIDKISDNLKQLAALMKVHDPEKFLNLLVIKQQLNIINPTPTYVIQDEPNPRSIDEILKPPPKIERQKKKNPNMKISYGVMSAKEVVDAMKQRADDEERDEKAKEEENVSKVERQKAIQDLDAKVRLDREHLKALRAKNTKENKERIVKRKLDSQMKKEQGNELTQRPNDNDEPVKKRGRKKTTVKVEKNDPAYDRLM